MPHPVAAGVAPPSRCDVAIVGGGILGLAVARELQARRPRASVCVLEREHELAAHQSGHNSGVIHSGIYYAPGSLKARLCVQGAAALYAYCDASGIEARRCGKLIVATRADELLRLGELHRRGVANGVVGLRRLDSAGIARVEPHARGIAALHAAATGVVDFAAVTRSFARDVLAVGGAVATGCELLGVRVSARTLSLTHTRGVTEAGHAIFCAGAWADRLAVLAGADPDPRVVPFRGTYLRLLPGRERLVRALIYPVPDPALPFLGVHLTRGIADEVLIGPTAFLSCARGPGRTPRSRARDALDTLGWPGTWRMLARERATAVEELRRAASRAAVVAAAARYVPELRSGDAAPAFSGVRAQALGRDGRLVDDFVLSHTERALHVRNAPSPAATSSLALARHIAAEAERAFDG